MKINEMRNMSIEEIRSQIHKLKVEIANLNLKIANSDTTAIKDRRLKKKEIARLSTVANEKNILEEINKEDENA